MPTVTYEGVVPGPAAPEYVDLGLPSGTLWANCNVGATSLANRGNYYSWGETTPKLSYAWSFYKHGNSMSNVTKYNDNDNYVVLLAEDDPATAEWGEDWRTPTSAEWKELANNQYCSYQWVTNYNGSGENGALFTSKMTGYEGRTLFIPAGGEIDNTSIIDNGAVGYYWAADVVSSTSASYVSLSSSYVNTNNSFEKNDGMQMRALKKSL